MGQAQGLNVARCSLREASRKEAPLLSCLTFWRGDPADVLSPDGPAQARDLSEGLSYKVLDGRQSHLSLLFR